MRRTLVGRKLLVASLGVAAVSYVACTSDDGNPATGEDGGEDAMQEDAMQRFSSSGNQMIPPPIDSGADAADATISADAADAGEATDAPIDAPADVTPDSPSDASDEGG